MSEHVAVVVVTYNSADVIAGLVASLGPGMGQVPWHLVVADNDSQDDTRRASWARWHRTRPCWRSRTTGATRQGSTPRSRPHRRTRPCSCSTPTSGSSRGACPTLLAAMRRTGAAIVVPQLLDASGELIHSMRRTPTVLRTLGDAFFGAVRAGRLPLLGEMVTDPRAYEREQDVDWAEGSTQLVDAARLERVGRGLLPLLRGDRVPPAHG